MEFLMTYGWAVLIMLIVIAILFMLGVFNPTTGVPNSCVMPQGFSCYGYAVRDGGVLSLDIGQATGGDVIINAIGCTAGDDPTLLTLNQRIKSGRHLNLTGLPTCYKEDGSVPETDEYFRGTLYIQYTDVRTRIVHNVKGDLAYRVEQTADGGSGHTPTPTPGGSATPTPTGTATPTPTATATPTPTVTPTPGPPDCAQGWTIMSCPCTLDVPGSYTLGTNLGPYAGTCITITADDVTLDCVNLAITGTGNEAPAGIDASSTSGTTILRCTVNNFQSGLGFHSATNAVVNSNHFDSNTYAGVYCSSGCTGNQFNGNTMSDNDVAGVVFGGNCNSNTFNSNTLNSNGMVGYTMGFYSQNNIFTFNYMQYNGWWGMCMEVGSRYNSFTGNTITGNTGHSGNVGYAKDFHCGCMSTVPSGDDVNTDNGNACGGHNSGWCPWLWSC